MLPQGVGFLLGLSRRAGKLAAGDWATRDAMRSGHARLVILAETAGAATARKFSGLCREAGVPLYQFGTAEELGHAVGLDPKAVLAVTGAEIAMGIRAALDKAGTMPVPLRRDPGGS